MASPVAKPDDRPRVPSRYRVHRLSEPCATERGLLYRRGARRYLLAWERVCCALAGAVGERALFDLAVRVEGSECVVFRVETADGPEAASLARALRLGVGEARCHPWLGEAGPRRAWPDVAAFEDAALESIRYG